MTARTDNEAQREFMKKHGNPQQFEAAVWRAWAALEITTDEACKALDDYMRDFNRLGGTDG